MKLAISCIASVSGKFYRKKLNRELLELNGFRVEVLDL